MKTSVSLKIIAGCGIFYYSWLASGTIRAQQLAGQNQAQPAARPPRNSTVKNNAASQVAPAAIVPNPFDYPHVVCSQTLVPNPFDDPHFVCSETLVGSDFTVEGNVIHVNAAAKISSRVLTLVYMWRLKFIDPVTDTPIIDLPYLDQKFSVSTSGVMSVTFSDSVQLPAGNYRCRLSLYHLPDDDLVENVLHDPVKERGAAVLSTSWKYIGIP